MNSNRSSRLATALVATVLALAVATPVVAAVSVSPDGVPDEAEQGTDLEARFTLTELYTDYESWTLEGETDLREVTWTVQQFDQAGNQVSQQSYDGQSFNESVSLDSDASEIRVRVTGTVPEVTEFSYDPEESFTVAAFTLVRQGGTQQALDGYSTHHFTAESKQARQAIDEAGAAVDGVDNQQARNQLNRAIEAYNNGNFDLAIDLAEDAEQTARQAERSRQRTQLALYGGLGVLALVVVFGGVYYWQSQQDTYDKLR